MTGARLAPQFGRRGPVVGEAQCGRPEKSEDERQEAAGLRGDICGGAA